MWMSHSNLHFVDDFPTFTQLKPMKFPIQGGAPKIAKLVYNSNNYGL